MASGAADSDSLTVFMRKNLLPAARRVKRKVTLPGKSSSILRDGSDNQYPFQTESQPDAPIDPARQSRNQTPHSRRLRRRLPSVKSAVCRAGNSSQIAKNLTDSGMVTFRDMPHILQRSAKRLICSVRNTRGIPRHPGVGCKAAGRQGADSQAKTYSRAIDPTCHYCSAAAGVMSNSARSCCRNTRIPVCLPMRSSVNRR